MKYPTNAVRIRYQIIVSNFETLCKVSKYRVFSGLYFPVFGLGTEIYRVNLRIQFKYGKYRPEKTPYLDTFYKVKVLVGLSIKKFKEVNHGKNIS